MTDRASLIRCGFSLVCYEGQNGKFLANKPTLTDMPRAAAQLVDDETFFGDMKAITEVTFDGRVYFLILEVDQLEGSVPLASPQVLLDDAGLLD